MRGKLGFALVTLAFCTAVRADTYPDLEESPITKVVLVGSYNALGGGDVYFQLQEPTANCPAGYWMTKSDPGFSSNMAAVISAYHAKSSVTIFGMPNQTWSGTAARACKLYLIQLR